MACLLVVPKVAAEANAYLKAKGTKQGDLRGPSTGKGHEGQIVVISTSHDLSVPLDLVTGQPTGPLAHQPLVITKEIDATSPQLRDALDKGEIFSIFTLDYVRPSQQTGTEATYLRINLTNARVVSIRHVMPNNKDSTTAKLNAYESVSFAYSSIEWVSFTNGTSGASATSHWSRPN